MREPAKLGLRSFVSAISCPEATPCRSTCCSSAALLGRIFGIEDRAEALVDEQRAAFAPAQEVGKDVSDKPTVLWLYSTFNGTPYVAGGMGSADRDERHARRGARIH